MVNSLRRKINFGSFWKWNVDLNVSQCQICVCPIIPEMGVEMGEKTVPFIPEMGEKMGKKTVYFVGGTVSF
jgi:hypothetical protein